MKLFFYIYYLDIDSAVNRDIAKTKEFQETNKAKSSVHDASLNCSSFDLEKLFEVINERIAIKTGSSLGDHRVKKAYEIFADGRNTFIDRVQLKKVLQSRLSLSVPG